MEDVDQVVITVLAPGTDGELQVHLGRHAHGH
jgi:hypothetical protein